MKHLLTIVSCFAVLSMSAQVPGYVPQNGLISWHNLDGNAESSFGPYEGALSGTTPALNRHGEEAMALRFEDGDHVALGNYAELQGSCEFTISIWFKPDQSNEGANMLWCSGLNHWLLNFPSTDVVVIDTGTYCNQQYASGNTLQNDEWHHVVTVLSDGLVTVWVNNEIYAILEVNTCMCSHPYTMMLATMDGYPHNFVGSLDEFGTWNRALDNWEIEMLYSEVLPSPGCTDVTACNYDPNAVLDDGSCVPAGCMDTNACNFNSEAGCDDGSCLVLDPLLCDIDSIIEVDLCGQDSIQLGFVSGELQPFIPITQLNWKSSCEFQEGWNLMGFDDSSWSAPIQTVCGGSTSNNQLAAQYSDCGGDDHMIWAGDCSDSFFRLPFNWDGTSTLYLEMSADDFFDVYLNGTLIFSGAGWESCFLVDQFSSAYSGDNLLAIQGGDNGTCKGLFGKAYGPSFQQNFLWSTGQTSSQIWVDSPGIYTVDSFEEDVTVAFIVTSDNIQGCTDGSACNYDELAECDDLSCVYPLIGGDCSLGAVSCGQGTVWDSTNQICIPSPSICNEGTYWDDETQTCMPINSCPEDLNYDGIIGVEDLLTLLSSFGTPCDPPVAEWTCGDPVSYHGYDYETVLIGEQCWFAENLRTFTFLNHENIESNLVDSLWIEAQDLEGPACTIYGQDLAAVCNSYSPSFDACDADSTFIYHEYGVLYNWYAVADPRGLCPSDWRVPADFDWINLESTIGLNQLELYEFGWRGTDEAYSLKEPLGWALEGDGSNTTGFSVKPSGTRDIMGDTGQTQYSGAGNTALFWTSTFFTSFQTYDAAIFRILGTGGEILRGHTHTGNGASVRCIKD